MMTRGRIAAEIVAVASWMGLPVPAAARTPVVDEQRGVLTPAPVLEHPGRLNAAASQPAAEET